MPRASVTRCRFVPGLPRSVGFGPVAEPLFRRDGGAVQARSAPVDLAGCVKALQETLMQPSPHAGLLPVPQPPPAAHARAALHLDRQPLPRDARAQNEQDASQSSSVLQGRTTALWTRLRGRKKRGDLQPEIVGEDRFGDPRQRAITRFVRRSKSGAGFLNCPRYIHHYRREHSSRYVPDAQGAAPVAEWKRLEFLQEDLC